jgi:hypothetical protein
VAVVGLPEAGAAAVVVVAVAAAAEARPAEAAADSVGAVDLPAAGLEAGEEEEEDAVAAGSVVVASVEGVAAGRQVRVITNYLTSIIHDIYT